MYIFYLFGCLAVPVVLRKYKAEDNIGFEMFLMYVTLYIYIVLPLQ